MRGVSSDTVPHFILGILSFKSVDMKVYIFGNGNISYADFEALYISLSDD